MYCTSLQITPKGLRDVIVWIKEEYGEEWEILITENGFADEGELNDTIRITYLAVSIQYPVELHVVLRSPHMEIIIIIIIIPPWQ
jgi:beta-glucosidase/6-phospho-beta-glucosidase/beta-galactosidase